MILDSIERDKGVKKEILVKAIESALLSAARKKLGKHIMDIKVDFDQETGEFKVFGPDGNELSGVYCPARDEGAAEMGGPAP
ncbi:MAG: hypothetical protein KJ985_08185 [Proteobacteria bacterium]|nr:hypothetical protein [Pseudomonadota bacterium]